MADAQLSIDAQLEELRVKYGQSLPARVHQVRELWAAIDGSDDAKNSLGKLHRAVHTLAGSGATFGYTGISEAARSIEDLLSPSNESIKAPSAREITTIETLLDRLEEASTAGTRQAQFSAQLKPGVSSETGRKEIFLVEKDADTARDLARDIALAGYYVTLFPTLDGLEESLAKRRPGAIIVGSEWIGENPPCAATIERRSSFGESPPPVLLISQTNDFQSRLHALRAGATAFFPKPVDMARLIEALDKLTGQARPIPFRILVIEDDPAIADYYASVLQAAGMATKTLGDPMAVMESIVDFSPDLILTDLYMPGCSGLELAQVIRQQRAYDAIPLVFLSSENCPETQLAAIGLGGDAFLTKPISDHHLIASITSRAERSRMVRSLMVRDSLTGLFNHAHIKEQLSLEVSRAARAGANFSYVMLDIDHFKQVNDSYGHPTGDRVIQSLSQMLTRRLRKADIVGRYGGEEFAVILLDTGAQEARRIIDGIRRAFADITYQSGDRNFSVSFSSGVAEFSLFNDDEQLNDAADKALYEAKHGGRNRVVLAQKQT